MALPHAGSWNLFGVQLPELGLTEKIGSFLGAPQTQQGGSDISSVFAPQASTPQQPFTPSTNMYSTVGTTNPQQIFQPQASTGGGGSQPQTQQSSGGGGEDFLNYYQGWNSDQAKADFNQAFGGDLNALRRSRGIYTDQERQDQQNQLRSQIDQIYNPLFSNLSQQEQTLQNVEYPTSLAGLQSSTAQLQEDLKTKQQEQLQVISGQEESLGAKRMSAADEARRNFLALKQQSQARFGGRGSAAMAATEIAAQGFARAQGGVERQYAEAFQQLVGHRNKVDSFVISESSRISREMEQAKLQLQTELKRRIDAIRADKNTLESARAQSILGVFQQMQAQSQAIQDARTSAMIQLDQWRAQQQFLIDKGLAGIQQQVAATNFSNIFPQQNITTQTPQVTQQPQYVAQGGRPEDQFNQLINPFA